MSARPRPAGPGQPGMGAPGTPRAEEGNPAATGSPDLGAAPTAADWRNAYAALAQSLPDLVRRARLTLCGMSLCVDAYVRLEQAAVLLEADPASPEGRFAALVLDRARRGVGGEIHLDWPGGPAWIDAHLPTTLGLGGTGPQAAQMLAALGAPSLVAIGDRTRRQIELFHPEVGLAGPDGLTCMGAVTGLPGTGKPGTGKPAHYIVEFQAGARIGGEVLPRSSRIICRFADDPLEDDPLFEALSLRLAGQAGAAILSGYNEVPATLLPESIRHTAGLARTWREAGLALVHLELGDFPDMNDAWPVLDGLRGALGSVGLSLSELDKLLPGAGGDVAGRTIALAERLEVDRVVVHFDSFALAVTAGDPALELQALMAGSLLASTRAAQGRVAVPDGPPEAAVFEPAPFPPIHRQAGRAVVTCPTPWLKYPAATIGLGDTFLAGALLVLGGAR